MLPGKKAKLSVSLPGLNLWQARHGLEAYLLLIHMDPLPQDVTFNSRATYKSNIFLVLYRIEITQINV